MAGLFDTIQSFMVAYGLALYLIILPPLIKYRKSEDLNKPFFRLCTSMAFFDIWGILAKIVLPIIEDAYGQVGWVAKVYGYASTVPWWGVLLHQFLIALDRLAAIALPMGTQDKLLSGRKLTIAMTVVWIVSFTFNIPVVKKVYL